MPEDLPEGADSPLDVLARHLARLARQAERAGFDDARDLLRAAERALRGEPGDEG